MARSLLLLAALMPLAYAYEDYYNDMSYSMSFSFSYDDDGEYKDLPFCTDSFFDLVKSGFEVAGATENTAEQAKLLVEVVCACDIPADVTDQTDPVEFWEDLINSDQSDLCESILSDLADTVDAFDVCGVDQGDLQALLEECPDYLYSLIPAELIPYLGNAADTITECIDEGNDLNDFKTALCDEDDDMNTDDMNSTTCASDFIDFLEVVAGDDVATNFKNSVCGTNKPTPMPTTLEPTLEPTSPTPEPTHLPTVKPTTIPIPMPTAQPTPSPTVTYMPTELTPRPTLVPIPAPTPVPSTSFPSMVPLPAPTMNPIPAPTPRPSKTPTSAPTSWPTRVPTPAPSAPPTSVDTTTLAVALQLSATAEPTNNDKTNLKSDVVSSTGLSESNIKNFDVVYTARRRRQILTGTWDVSFDVVASLAEVGETDATSFQTNVESDLSSTSFSTAVQDSISSVSSVDSVTSVIQTRNPSSVPVPAPTGHPTMPPIPAPTVVPVPAPSAVPVPAPTPAPKKKKSKSNGANAASLAVILIAVGAGVFVIVAGGIAYCQYQRSQKADMNEHFGAADGEEVNNFVNTYDTKGVESTTANPTFKRALDL
mmetsp:Transcript_31324/g.40289  ORF Transcript_31324/g.40289 Transcript_31324/m.40289 type:complete len:596 (+) Transcript_31324:55-1842(+)